MIELDKRFWATDLTPMPRDRWAATQLRFVSEEAWILDGDLGPFDVLDVRVAAADTVIVLDFALWRCAWRALRRSRENWTFWRWFISYRRRSLPLVMAIIADNAATQSSTCCEVRVMSNGSSQAQRRQPGPT